jgi:hypothetical protein
MTTDRPATQIEALRAALVACGFLLSGEREADRISLAEAPEGIEAWLELDYPDEPVETPCAVSDLMAGVALRVRGGRQVSVETLKRAKHAIMVRLHAAGFWPGGPGPTADWREVVLMPEEVENAETEQR